MTTNKEKYFIAWVPTGAVQQHAEEIKRKLQEKFGVKYALKSPAHVTVKMPFLWNGHKEADLVKKLGAFFSSHESFPLILKGFSHFRQRVIFIKVMPQRRLETLQEELGRYCKLNLKLDAELSDQVFKPHMTVAYNDLKKRDFEDCFGYVKSLTFDRLARVDEFALLKKIEGRWEVVSFLKLGQGKADSVD
ncbi:2'-5' RNA ligase [Lunatimonas lonarensis]|uniref:2'-5' RNA ligase n=1 Tax=Lunatimonas lonarensis TaxID=1232681 RepID=R7ZN89_9BACT|nr:2'-5' RNA ligase family protein [Lunatimonas lonarensis]EON75542.1 2'-5' RNA ligase [Lunatimonas lonarensis]